MIDGLILHHYDFSNFAEKVRLMLGFKSANWMSVEIPSIDPKPDYTVLTAGYRRTPALQVGADVYCDTHLIADMLEELMPEPSFFPAHDPQCAQAKRAMADILSAWAESVWLWPAALFITGENAARFPEAFHHDRARLHGKKPVPVARVQAAAGRYRPQWEIQLGWLNDLLNDGSPYLGGATPGLADICVYAVPWFVETVGGPSREIDQYPRVRAWMRRVVELGHGVSDSMAAGAALEIARAVSPRPVAEPKSCEPELRIGQRVEVYPLTERSPAYGELVNLSDTRITIAHVDRRCGQVHVHFPRLGYGLRAVSD
ncbi:MAG: glutathione S-transferase family protein [Gammaproteobacteria bacterium]|nr:glutathione S-transferase family protein [Gammaproteobacteria bacterium]